MSHDRELTCTAWQSRLVCRRIACAPALALLVATVASSAAAQATPRDSSSDRTWVVTVRIPRAYVADTGSFSSALALARLLPPTQATLTREDGSLSGLVSRLYALGPSVSAQYSDSLLSEIRRLNGITDDRRVQPGLLKVPTLPRYRPTKGLGRGAFDKGYDPSLPQNRTAVAFVLTDSGFSRERSARYEMVDIETMDYLSDKWLNDLSAQALKGPGTVALSFATGDTTLLRLAAEQGTQVDGPLDVLVSPGGVAGTAGPSGTPFTTDAAVLSAVAEAARRARGRGQMVVLDLNWPSAASAAASSAWFASAINRWRAAIGLRCPVPARIVAVPANAATTHAAAIARAVASLDSAAALPVVDVRYLPLLPDAGTDSLLVDLLHTYVSQQQQAMRRDACDTAARGVARDIVSRMPRKVSESAAVVTLRASRGVLDALIGLLDAESQVTGRPYFLSTSWILTSRLYRMPLPTQPLKGLIVAAAGNQSEEVLAKQRDLGRWIADSRQVLLVGNIGADGSLDCSSSRADASSEAFTLRRFIAFQGRIPRTGSYECGTSFSAPRVAWLLALASTDQAPVQNWTLYSDRLWRTILQSAPLNAHGVPELQPRRLLSPSSP